MIIWVATDSNGKCFVFYTLKEAEECLKQCNLNKMPKFREKFNKMRCYEGINHEDSYIQNCELEKLKK
ncbi:hypothetical protein LCGC14_2688780 [marine sediment metagenome]|uniref:Uncharacterized protein n=1 Tax=marine sediment metagenome TaxID=412755 RepID=A0A0F8ZJ77_9ZZZZ